MDRIGQLLVLEVIIATITAHHVRARRKKDQELNSIWNGVMVTSLQFFVLYI